MKVKTIDVNCLEWFDKINGNSYFAGEVIVNYGLKTAKVFIIPFQYGYGDQFRYEAWETLKRNKVINFDSWSIWQFFEKNKIIERYNIQRNCKKRDWIHELGGCRYGERGYVKNKFLT